MVPRGMADAVKSREIAQRATRRSERSASGRTRGHAANGWYRFTGTSGSLAAQAVRKGIARWADGPCPPGGNPGPRGCPAPAGLLHAAAVLRSRTVPLCPFAVEKANAQVAASFGRVVHRAADAGIDLPPCTQRDIRRALAGCPGAGCHGQKAPRMACCRPAPHVAAWAGRQRFKAAGAIDPLNTAFWTTYR